MGKLYELVVGDCGAIGIRCLRCRRVSWNPHDVRERYCGACHEFLEDLARRESLLGESNDHP